MFFLSCGLSVYIRNTLWGADFDSKSLPNYLSFYISSKWNLMVPRWEGSHHIQRGTSQSSPFSFASLWYFFSSVALYGISRSIFNINGENVHCCLVLDLREIILAFPYSLGCCLFIWHSPACLCWGMYLLHFICLRY